MISGQSPQRILGCPICGYRVNPKDSTCPRCGSEFFEGTKFECPLCGGLVSSADRSCPACHVNYEDFRERTIARGSDESIDALLNEIIGLESNLVKDEDKHFSCPNCSWMLDGSEASCPRCGHDFGADTNFQCPVCGSFVSSHAHVCSECGARFGGANGMPQHPETEPALETPEPEPERPKAIEEQPPPEPRKEVKPIIVVKPPAIVARPSPERTAAPEPAEKPVEIDFDDLELEEKKTEAPVPVAEAPSEDIQAIEHATEPPAVPAETPDLPETSDKAPKKGSKKRKLKAKPKG